MASPPEKTVKVGQVQVAKWIFKGDKFDNVAYTIQKSYKKKGSDKYETTNYLKASDLADLQVAIDEVQRERVKVYSPKQDAVPLSERQSDEQSF